MNGVVGFAAHSSEGNMRSLVARRLMSIITSPRPNFDVLSLTVSKLVSHAPVSTLGEILSVCPQARVASCPWSDILPPLLVHVGSFLEFPTTLGLERVCAKWRSVAVRNGACGTISLTDDSVSRVGGFQRWVTLLRSHLCSLHTIDLKQMKSTNEFDHFRQPWEYRDILRRLSWLHVSLPRLTSLSLHCNVNKREFLLLCSMTKLRALSFSAPSPCELCAHNEYEDPYNPNITIVDNSGDAVRQFCKHEPSVEGDSCFSHPLGFCYKNELQARDWSPLSQLTRLERFEFVGNSGVTERILLAVSTLPRLKHLVLQWWVPFYDARALDRVAERCEEQQSLFPALERLVLDTTNPYLERQDVDGVNVLVAEDDDQYVYDTSCSDLDFLQNPLFMPCLREIRLDRKAAFVCAHSQGFSHFGRNVAVFAGHVPIVPIVRSQVDRPTDHESVFEADDARESEVENRLL